MTPQDAAVASLLLWGIVWVLGRVPPKSWHRGVLGQFTCPLSVECMEIPLSDCPFPESFQFHPQSPQTVFYAYQAFRKFSVSVEHSTLPTRMGFIINRKKFFHTNSQGEKKKCSSSKKNGCLRRFPSRRFFFLLFKNKFYLPSLLKLFVIAIFCEIAASKRRTRREKNHWVNVYYRQALF